MWNVNITKILKSGAMSHDCSKNVPPEKERERVRYRVRKKQQENMIILNMTYR